MNRFLADRFVEGICPHCGYEVRLPAFPSISDYIKVPRMLVEISAIFAVAP